MNIINEGKKFEKAIKDSIPKDTYFLRLIDPPSSWGDNTNLRFSQKNPYDMIMYSYPNFFPTELKSTKGTAFSFKGTTPMIKQHQIEALTKAAQYEGIIAGFLFNFRKKNTQKTYYLDINDFNDFLKKTNKSSINEKDITNNEAIEIEGKIKRVNWKWNIEELIKKIKERIK